MRPMLVLLAFIAACGGREVTVRVTIPNLDGVETPLTGLVVAFLPYDRDSIIQSLEARAPTQRPHARELDSLFRGFREPFTGFLRLAAAQERLQRESDSLGRLGDLPPPSSAARLTQVRDSLSRLAPEVAAARAALDRARASYWPAIESLRTAARDWSKTTYAGYDSIVRRTPGRRLANPVADTTDPGGWATIELPNGRWWVTATSIDPTDPNAEWYWNLELQRDTVLLSPRTGRNRPRY
jgi:hypothetical protein